MNSNDFEKELKAQPFRAVPPEWKREIFKGTSPKAQRTSRSWLGLRELFWPSPFAWGTLAAVWIGIAGFNLATRDREDRLAVQTDYTQLRVALEEKRSLQGETEETYAQRKPEAAKPRSHARSQCIAG
jgi:hypothetical protein